VDMGIWGYRAYIWYIGPWGHGRGYFGYWDVGG